MASSYISPQTGSSPLGTHYFISKHDCYFEPLGYVMGGWEILDLSSILFIKSKLYCRRFALLCNSEILFYKISDNRILRFSNLSISHWNSVSCPLFKASKYHTTLVPLPEKVAPLKALVYDRIFAR